jgi:hypothetical protein
MPFELKYVFVKILLVIIIILLYIIIVNYSNISSFISRNNNIETFEEQIEKEKYNYLKLKETYINSKDTSLDLLYANYYGEEVNKDVWEDKTFEQCIDTCNKLDNCIGFSRDLVLDTEPAKCYPITSIQQCHSNRKGNSKQMSKALKYNSYIKSHVPNVINHCIGDNDLTLNRIIYIKSYSKPNQYIGNNGDSRVSMIDNNSNDFKINCGFRIEQGKDGVGTISFLHLNSYKYLYRNNDNNLIFKDINNNSNKTEDKQRASFNIYDGLSNGIMFKALPIEGETTNKYIIIDNTYLKIDKLNTLNDNSNNNSNSTSNNSNKLKELSTFYIIDTIIESKIITDKNNIVNTPVTTQSNNTNQTIVDVDVQEDFTDKLALDNTVNIGVYNKLFNKDDNSNANGTNNLSDYIQDTYLSKTNNDKFITITKKYNEDSLKKILSTSINKNQDHFNYINALNKEIEKEIANKNLDLHAKNDKIINNLDKLRITDLSKDYFFLQSLTQNTQPSQQTQNSQPTKK